MPIINRTKRTAAIYNRGREVVKVYDHGKLAWQKSIPDYLCFTALESGTFTLTIPAVVTPTYLSYVEWSKDGRTWNHTDNTSEAVTIDVQVAQGEKVYWRGSGSRMAYDYNANKYSVFSSTGTFDVSGDLRSLLFADDFENVTTTNQQYCFTGLFDGASVVDASNLRLALTGHAAYMYCFRGCTQLLHAPALMEGNTIMQWQFHSTYQDCSNLITGTDLQATSVGVRGFYYTYRSCTSLVKAPNISSITTIGNSGLCAMFWGCTSLTYIKCLATSLYDDGDASHFATSNWLVGASSTGIFIQAEGVVWPRGASGIPTGWVDVEKRTMPSGYKQVEYVANPNYGYININRAFESNAETLEIAFVKQATGASQPFGNTTYNYRYGSLKVFEQASALALNIGVDFANKVNKVVSIASVSAEEPHTLQYVGSSSGFQLYLDGVSKSTQTCAWDAVNPFATNLVFSGASSASYSQYSHTLPIYYVKIWDGNGALALDYVAAVRESDGVAGFYDMANNVFHKSDNANDFTAGEEI